MSKAYQRIKYHSLQIIVTPQASTMIMGGYVAGFVMDPEDLLITSKTLSSVQGAVQKKWYEAAVVNMPHKPDLLYTSPGEEPRLTQPAVFWVCGEGVPNAALTYILTLKWDVTLSEPTVEKQDSYSFTMVGSIVSKKANYNLQWVKNQGAEGTDDVSELVPEGVKFEKGNHFWRVPTFNIEYSEGTGDTGTKQMHFLVYTGDKRFYFSDNGVTIDKTVWQSNLGVQVCIPCGTFCKYVGEGNVCPPASLRLRSSELPEPSKSQERFLQLQRRLESLELSLRGLRLSSSPNFKSLNASWESVHQGLE